MTFPVDARAGSPLAMRGGGFLSFPPVPATWRRLGIAVATLAFFPSLVLAAEYGPPQITWTQFIGLGVFWLFVGVIGAVSAIVNIWYRTKPNPSLSQQFAARKHDHPEYMTWDGYRDQYQRCSEDRVKAAADAQREQTIIHQRIEKLSRTVSDGFTRIEKNSEERARLMHERMNNIANPLNQLIGRVDTHIEAEKQERKSS